ncbi:MAG: hypothetical protein AB7K09_00585 [Planctomycetota bacterium]
MRITLALTLLFMLLAAIGCESRPAVHRGPGDVGRAPAAELEGPYDGDGFTIQPPRDWRKEKVSARNPLTGNLEKDTVLKPGANHATMRDSHARVVVSWVELPVDGPMVESPDALAEVCEHAIESKDRKLINRELRMDGPRMVATFEVLTELKDGTERHYIVNVLDPAWGGRAFWRVAASCWSDWWDYASPMMLRSLESARFIRKPTHEFDVPPGMREEERR